MVTVATNIPVEKYDEIIDKVQSVTLATPSLTPRTRYELLKALKTNSLAVAFDDNNVIGWLIATPYSSTTQEIGMAYILPSYRNSGMLHRMIAELINKCPVTIAVTYESRLKRSLVNQWGFELSSLYELVRVSRGHFLVNRFKSIRSIAAVFAHATHKRPLYLIKRVQEK